jgi:hypothetical protein
MASLFSLPTDRVVIGYGASLAAHAALTADAPASRPVRCEFLVDASPTLHGKTLAGTPIRPVQALEDLIADRGHDRVFVILFAWGTANLRRMWAHAVSLGLQHGCDFTDCSTLFFEPIRERIEATLGLRADPELFRTLRALSLESAIDNQSSVSGTWLCREILGWQLAHHPGDVAEAGVYAGGNAFFTLASAPPELRRRRCHLFDSFTGLPPLSAFDPASRQGEFANVDLGSVRARFAHFPWAVLHVGRFAETFAQMPSARYCFAHLDCDLYESAGECLDYFYPRLPRGGILLFHDYWVERPGLPEGIQQPFTGIRRAVDEFLAGRQENVVCFPETTHALLVKCAD